MNTTEIKTRDDLLTDCERSMRYHQARARFFNALHLFILFVVFTIASANVLRLIETVFPELVISVFWAVVSVLALISLVYNPAAKYYLHQSLYEDFTKLSGDIASTCDPDRATLSQWTKQIHALYAKEPPTYRALHAHCGNQVVIALGAEATHLRKLRWHQRVFRNFYSFQGTVFPLEKQAH